MRKVKYVSTNFSIEQKDSKTSSRDVSKYEYFQSATFDIGFRILIPLLLFIFIGKKLDSYFELEKFWTVIGIICGCCFIFVAMIKLARDK